jgi:four helix bundle protein
MRDDVPIIQKTYDFYREFYKLIPQIPKLDRYTLAQKIEKSCLDMLELLICASRKEKNGKLQLLDQAATKLDLLKLFLRLGEETKAIPSKRYLDLSKMLQEIGRMLGGWIRSIN